MVDKFFDCLNVHNYTHGIHSRKVNQMPYTTAKDRRVKVGLLRGSSGHCALCTLSIYSSQWLEEDFLGYLDAWESSVNSRPGYTKTEKGKMMLSPATRIGLRITCEYQLYMNV